MKHSSAFHSDKRFGYIRRGDAAYPVELDDDALLAGDTGDTALDATEVAIGDDDMVAILEVALGAIDEENVVAVDACQADEVTHLLIGNGERGIRAVGIGAEVIVVVTEIGIGRGREGKVKSFLRSLDEEEIGDERLLHAFLLTSNLLFGIMHGEIGVDANLCQPVLGHLLVMVSHTQDKPLFLLHLLTIVLCCQRSILYRHPGLVLTGGRARGKPRTGKETAAFSAVHIRQRVHRFYVRYMKKAWNLRHPFHTSRLW